MSNRETLWDAVKTQLALIPGITTVGNVHYDWAEFETIELPYIGFGSDPSKGTEYTYQPTQRVRFDCNFAIQVVVASSPGTDDKITTISALELEVLKAIETVSNDRQTNIDVQFRGAFYDEVDPYDDPVKDFGLLMMYGTAKFDEFLG